VSIQANDDDGSSTPGQPASAPNRDPFKGFKFRPGKGVQGFRRDSDPEIAIIAEDRPVDEMSDGPGARPSSSQQKDDIESTGG
jgi:hypothetical protein